MWRIFLSIVVATAVIYPAALTSADGAELKFRHKIKGYHGAPSGPEKSPDGELIVRVEGLSVLLYDRKTGKQVCTLRHPDRPRKGLMEVSHWAFSPDGKLLAVGVGDEKYKGTDDTAGGVYVWKVATGKLVKTYDRDIGRVTELKFLDNSTLLIYSFDISGK